MTITPFDPGRDLIIVPAEVEGPHQATRLRLAVDTGSGATILSTDIIDAIGLSARQGEAFSRLRSVVAEERGYTVRVQRFTALGFEFSDFRVHAHAIPDGWEIDGLLGWDFLRRFRFEVRPDEGRILATPVPVP